MSMKQLLLTLILIPAALHVAGKDKYVDPYQDYDEAVFMDMDFDRNLETPEIIDADKIIVRRYMAKLADEYASKQYTIDLLRDDEVMLITIPSDDLFLPNDTLLSPYAGAKLNPLLNLMKEPDMFKVVYGIHTDNTGSERYNLDLSHRRNNSIYDWLLDHISEDQIVIPFEFGDTEPIDSNETRAGRAHNRRIEVFFIPGPRLIDMAHKKQLKYPEK